MAIRDTSKKPYLQDNDDNVKIGIDLPIRRGDDIGGFFATTSTTIEAVKNNIRNLLNTNEGERFFQPTIGLNLKTLLFEHINDDTFIAIEDAIIDRIELWLPFVQIRDIKINTIESKQIVGANEIKIEIVFNITQDPNTLDSVTLSVDGNSTINSESSVGAGGY
tara:strand:- start:159 stop:650 length:492 start_codon:yes stop_codon:yes gene_type:complete